MTKQERDKVLSLYFDLETGMKEYYGKALLWLLHGNHKEYPPTEKETRQLLKEAKEKMISLLNEIETEIQ